jgi:uncharacterized repeat protein (TIGR02543 family)
VTGGDCDGSKTINMNGSTSESNPVYQSVCNSTGELKITSTVTWNNMWFKCTQTTSITYTIEYNANYTGGTSPQSATTGTDGKLASLPQPTRSGYDFAGWFTDNGTRVTTSTVFTQNTTVYARWTYTVTYDANEGTSAPNPQTEIDGISLTLSNTEPTRSGYIFTGWGPTTALATISPGHTYGGPSVTLYAVWMEAATCEAQSNIGTYCPGILWANVKWNQSPAGNPNTAGCYYVTDATVFNCNAPYKVNNLNKDGGNTAVSGYWASGNPAYPSKIDGGYYIYVESGGVYCDMTGTAGSKPACAQ